MFPGAGARVYRNEAGEPIGWDYPSDDEYDPDAFLPGTDAEWCDECGEAVDEQDGCMCEDSAVEDDPDQPILGQAVESIDPNPDII